MQCEGVDNAGMLALSCSIPSDQYCRLLVPGWRVSHSVAVEIYCVKCQANTSTISVESVATKNECPATKVVCAVCGTGKYRTGATSVETS